MSKGYEQAFYKRGNSKTATAHEDNVPDHW